MSKKIISVTLGLLAINFLLLPAFVLAQQPNYGLDIANTIGLGARDPRLIATAIVRTLLGFLGLIAVILILVGGFRWMTAAGNQEKVDTAKKTLTAGIIGLIIIVAAFAITNFVITSLVNVTQ